MNEGLKCKKMTRIRIKNVSDCLCTLVGWLYKAELVCRAMLKLNSSADAK